VARVDIWVDPETGLPLRVAVFGKGYDGAALTSTFLDLTTETPSASDTSFALPPGAELRFDDVVDVAAAADHLTDHFPGLVPPAMLAGLTRRVVDDRLGAVGHYGRGVTRLVAVPLWDEVAIPLREQLSVTPGVRVGSLGSAIRREALSLRLTHRELSGYSWLLIGTVTPRTLRTAAAQLAARPLGPR
jgi:integrase